MKVIRPGLLGQIAISYSIFIVLSVLINSNGTSRLLSFIIVLFASIVALYYLGQRANATFGLVATRYFIIGLLFKEFIGFLFWEFYLFPDYFVKTDSVFHFQHFEYLITFERLQEIATYRMNNGFLSLPELAFADKYILVRYVMSTLFLSGSFYPFDLSVQNSLFSIYTAAIIGLIVREMGGTKAQIKFALLMTIYQPFSFVSTMIWRDVVGQFFVVLGGYLLYKAFRASTVKMVLLLLASIVSFFVTRYLYAFFPVIILCGYLFFVKRNKLGVLILPLLYIFIDYFDNLLSITKHLSDNYGDNVMGIKFWLLLPFSILRLFIGPFPWSNWFSFTDNTIFLIVHYLQAVVNVAFFWITVGLYGGGKLLLSSKFVSRETRSMDGLFLGLVFLFIMAGLGTEAVHVNYMSSGIIFLIPAISRASTTGNLVRVVFRVFIFFILLNVIFMSFGLSGLGLAKSLR